MRLLLLMALCVGNAWAGDTVIEETDDYGNEKPGKIVVKEGGKIYRVDWYCHGVEAGYRLMAEDGKSRSSTVRAREARVPARQAGRQDLQDQRLRQPLGGGVPADQGRQDLQGRWVRQQDPGG